MIIADKVSMVNELNKFFASVFTVESNVNYPDFLVKKVSNRHKLEICW